MASNPLFYHLLLIALMLLYLLVHVGLLKDSPHVPQTPREPQPRRHRRSKELKAVYPVTTENSSGPQQGKSPSVTSVRRGAPLASNSLFYHLLLVALVLICLCIQVAVSDDSPRAPQTPPDSNNRRRKRAPAPTPFPGVLHTPRCAACEQGADGASKAPGAPPPILRCTPGRRRSVDTRSHCCPAPDCAYRGGRGLGTIRANGHPGGQPWRQLQGVACQGYFSATQGTICHGTRSSAERIVRVMACLAEGLGIRGAARGGEMAPHTVRQWLVQAAEQLQALSAYLLHALPVNPVQLDALYAVLRALRDGPLSAAEASERLSRSPHWVWTAREPESTLRLSVQVGERPRAMAPAVLHQLAQLVAPGCVPLLVSDGYSQSLPALVTHCGHWVQPPQRQARGPVPKPRWRPRPALLSAQVGKSMRRRRLVAVHHRVVFGTQRAIAQVVAACGWQSNPSFVERRNVSLRQPVAAIGRRSATPWKSAEGLGQHLALCQGYHHVVFPHASLRQPVPVPEPTNGTGSAKRWRPCTPAMAAGVTDQVWSLQAVLRYRVPPWPQSLTV